MTTAKCYKCGGSAIAETFEQARKKINHAVGLSRGIKCGDNYNCVKEIGVVAKPKIVIPSKPKTPKPIISKPKTVTTETITDTIIETPELIIETITDTITETPKPVIETPKPQKTVSSVSEKPKQKKTQTNTKESKKQTFS